MSKKMCGLFVAPLLLVCVLSSCTPEKKAEPPPELVASVTSDFPVEPPILEKRDHCLQVTGWPNDEKYEYHYRYCYYPYNKSDVGAGRFRCSTGVADCINQSGECSKPPAQQTQC